MGRVESRRQPDIGKRWWLHFAGVYGVLNDRVCYTASLARLPFGLSTLAFYRFALAYALSLCAWPLWGVPGRREPDAEPSGFVGSCGNLRALLFTCLRLLAQNPGLGGLNFSCSMCSPELCVP